MPDFASILVSVALSAGAILFYEVAIQTWKKSSHWILIFMWLIVPLGFVIQRSEDGNLWMSLSLSLIAILLLPRKKLRVFIESRFNQVVSDIPFYDAQQRPSQSGWIVIFCYAVIVLFFFLP